MGVLIWAVLIVTLAVVAVATYVGLLIVPLRALGRTLAIIFVLALVVFWVAQLFIAGVLR